MRRPVKPFVTEYRGGVRRQAGAYGQGAKPDPTRLEPERSEPRAPEPWPIPDRSRAMAPPQEDGYEAALRAADALFAARSQDSKAGAPAERAPSEASEPTSPHLSGGRILRAIDEPPPPELLRLEAEFAPKRRGRKPGSKNKPKLPAPVVEAAIEAAIEPVAIEPLPFSTTKQIAALPIAYASRSPSTVAAGPKGDRYAWVRTKLKPGQQWKQRRLPKVAW